MLSRLRGDCLKAQDEVAGLHTSWHAAAQTERER